MKRVLFLLSICSVLMFIACTPEANGSPETTGDSENLKYYTCFETPEAVLESVITDFSFENNETSNQSVRSISLIDENDQEVTLEKVSRATQYIMDETTLLSVSKAI